MGPARVGAALACVATVLFASEPGQRQAPTYSATTIVNLASGKAGELAPNTLAAIYGQELATVTRARQASDLQGGYLPYVLPGTGVTVKVNGLLAGVEYVSPEAVVFVVPADLLPGPAAVVLTRNALNGPRVKVDLQAVAPALVPYEEGRVLARHGPEGAWVTVEDPARPGEEVVLYATGLGQTNPPQVNRMVASGRDALERGGELILEAGGRPVAGSLIAYAGVSPGFAGVYEIRFVLPQRLGPDPEVRLRLGERQSQEGLRLFAAEDGLAPASKE